MLEPWTGDVVKWMHIYEIRTKDLAFECGFAPEYVSTVLNCKKGDANTRKKLESALYRLIQKRKNDGKRLD